MEGIEVAAFLTYLFLLESSDCTLCT